MDKQTVKDKKIQLNLPFSKNAATKIGRYCVNIIDKHSPRDPKFSTEII